MPGAVNWFREQFQKTRERVEAGVQSARNLAALSNPSEARGDAVSPAQYRRFQIAAKGLYAMINPASSLVGVFWRHVSREKIELDLEAKSKQVQSATTLTSEWQQEMRILERNLYDNRGEALKLLTSIAKDSKGDFDIDRHLSVSFTELINQLEGVISDRDPRKKPVLSLLKSFRGSPAAAGLEDYARGRQLVQLFDSHRINPSSQLAREIFFHIALIRVGESHDLEAIYLEMNHVMEVFASADIKDFSIGLSGNMIGSLYDKGVLVKFDTSDVASLKRGAHQSLGWSGPSRRYELPEASSFSEMTTSISLSRKNRLARGVIR